VKEEVTFVNLLQYYCVPGVSNLQSSAPLQLSLLPLSPSYIGRDPNHPIHPRRPHLQTILDYIETIPETL